MYKNTKNRNSIEVIEYFLKGYINYFQRGV